MVENLKLYYHVTVLLVFFSALVWQLLNMADGQPEDRYIADILEYGERYFTIWNSIIQCSYFVLVTIEDINEYMSRKTFISRLKSHIFYPIVLPCASIVFTVFWGLFHYDRELIFPRAAEIYFTKYSNQIVHTAIIIFPLLEFYFISNHQEVSFKSCFISMTVLHVMYYIVFFYHYLTLGRFLYPVFSLLTCYQIPPFMLITYTVGLAAGKLGITIPKYLRKMKLEGFTSWKGVKCL